MDISLKEFMEMQPNNQYVADTDKYYAVVASRLAKVWDNAHLMTGLATDVRKRVVLSVVGYFQDIIADAGIWRSFSSLSGILYNRPVPLFDRPDDYIDSELNLIDIQFLIWYVVESSASARGFLSPHDKSLAAVAQLFFNVLDAIYDDAPTPVEYNMVMDVDLDASGEDDEENMRRLYDLTHWLFWNSYLMRPAADSAMRIYMPEAQKIISHHPDPEEAKPFLAELSRQIMASFPIGPLSLPIGDWLKMIVDQKIPSLSSIDDAPIQEHKFYKALIKATGGSPIAFFSSFDDLDSFLSDKMLWGKAEGGHFPSLCRHKNFVILGNPAKGFLIAHDVAQYINHPANTLFDPEQASINGHKIITEYQSAPIDLVKYLFQNNLVPDIHLPFDESGSILHDNWDFLARFYQQDSYHAI